MDPKGLTVSKELLNNFINLISVKGELENKELLMKVEEKSLSAIALSTSKVLCVKGTVEGEFINWGEIGIDNLALVKNFLNAAKVEKLNLKKTENKLTMEQPKLKFTSVLRNPKYIVNSLPDDKFAAACAKAQGNEFTLKAEQLQQAVTLLSSITPTTILISGKGKEITLEAVSNENHVELTLDIKEDVQEFSTKAAKLLLDVLAGVSSYDISFSIKKDVPIYFQIKQKGINFEYIFAPLNK